jgi:hypothetical protein
MGEIDVFRKDVGTWDAEVEVKVPGAPPQASRGTLVARMIGPWLVTDFKNETTGFEGRGTYGWDAAKKKYVGTWVDPMRASLVVMLGEWDAAKRTMTFVGEMPHEGGRGKVTWRETTETVDDATQVFRSFVHVAGSGEHEMMTVRYRKRS